MIMEGKPRPSRAIAKPLDWRGLFPRTQIVEVAYCPEGIVAIVTQHVLPPQAKEDKYYTE